MPACPNPYHADPQSVCTRRATTSVLASMTDRLSALLADNCPPHEAVSRNALPSVLLRARIRDGALLTLRGGRSPRAGPFLWVTFRRHMRRAVLR